MEEVCTEQRISSKFLQTHVHVYTGQIENFCLVAFSVHNRSVDTCSHFDSLMNTLSICNLHDKWSLSLEIVVDLSAWPVWTIAMGATHCMHSCRLFQSGRRKKEKVAATYLSHETHLCCFFEQNFVFHFHWLSHFQTIWFGLQNFLCHAPFKWVQSFTMPRFWEHFSKVFGSEKSWWASVLIQDVVETAFLSLPR